MFLTEEWSWRRYRWKKGDTFRYTFNGRYHKIPNLERDRQDVELTELKRVSIVQTIPSTGFIRKKEPKKQSFKALKLQSYASVLRIAIKKERKQVGESDSLIKLKFCYEFYE